MFEPLFLSHTTFYHLFIEEYQITKFFTEIFSKLLEFLEIFDAKKQDFYRQQQYIDKQTVSFIQTILLNLSFLKQQKKKLLLLKQGFLTTKVKNNLNRK